MPAAAPWDGLDKLYEEYKAAGRYWGEQTQEAQDLRERKCKELFATVPSTVMAKKEKEETTLDNLPRLLVISANNRNAVRRWFEHWFPVLAGRLDEYFGGNTDDSSKGKTQKWITFAEIMVARGAEALPKKQKIQFVDDSEAVVVKMASTSKGWRDDLLGAAAKDGNEIQLLFYQPKKCLLDLRSKRTVRGLEKLPQGENGVRGAGRGVVIKPVCDVDLMKHL